MASLIWSGVSRAPLVLPFEYAVNGPEGALCFGTLRLDYVRFESSIGIQAHAFQIAIPSKFPSPWAEGVFLAQLNKISQGKFDGFLPAAKLACLHGCCHHGVIDDDADFHGVSIGCCRCAAPQLIFCRRYCRGRVESPATG